MIPFSTLLPRDRISVTCLRPVAWRPQCTTRSMQDATVGTTKELEMFAPARSGRVQILVTASCAEFACTVHIPGKPEIVE